jgi:hypothetical protein
LRERTEERERFEEIRKTLESRAVEVETEFIESDSEGLHLQSHRGWDFVLHGGAAMSVSGI